MSKRMSPNRVNFVNQYNQAFPVEDLKFKNPEAADYIDFSDTQRHWDMYRDGSCIGSVEIESSIEYAREAFFEKMEEFKAMDEDERLATAMEAMLYRQMLRWNEDSKDTGLEGQKKHFMYNLNVFLNRQIDPDLRDEVLQETSVQQEVEQSYVPDEIDLSLQDLVRENKRDVTSYGTMISATAHYLNSKFDQRNNPLYNRISGKVDKPGPKPTF